MLNKLDEKDFILVQKLSVAPTQIRNRFKSITDFHHPRNLVSFTLKIVNLRENI